MENDKQYLLVITYSDGVQRAYMFATLRNAQGAFNVVKYDDIKFSVAVFECGKFGSVFEKIAERRPMNMARAI